MNDKNDKREISIPPPQENYETSLGIVRKNLEGCDMKERAEKAEAVWNESTREIQVTLLGRDLVVSADGLEVSEPSGGKVDLWEKIIVLHYLLTATGKKKTGKYITYKEIPDGRLYWPNFIARVHKPLLAAFGSRPGLLTEIASGMGGIPCDQGDVGVVIPALPMVDLVYLIWEGDDEFEPEAGTLFDATITDYLPAEDIIMMSSMTAIKMMKIAFSKGGDK